jgi:hypothetical protein
LPVVEVPGEEFYTEFAAVATSMRAAIGRDRYRSFTRMMDRGILTGDEWLDKLLDSLQQLTEFLQSKTAPSAEDQRRLTDASQALNGLNEVMPTWETLVRKNDIAHRASHARLKELLSLA